MTQIFFSIIVPTYNREAFLDKAINSVLNQSYENFELIIADDGSSDKTKQLVSSFSDKRVHYIKNDLNKGVAYARNIGLEKATGNYIAFLDSDDWWLNNKLEKAVEYIKRYKDIHIFHTGEIWLRNGKLLKQKDKHKNPSGWAYINALPLCCISISTAVLSKKVFDETGIFDESFEACEDYDFWLRATNRFEIKLIPEYLTEKDGGRPDQLSSSVWGLDRFRIRALEKMLISGDLSEENYRFTFQELKKKCRVFEEGCKKRGKQKETIYYQNLPNKYVI